MFGQREWNGRCHRCYKETNCYIMSMYNEDLICNDCKDAETKRSDYKDAVDADVRSIRNGNYNFPGIGYKK